MVAEHPQAVVAVFGVENPSLASNPDFQTKLCLHKLYSTSNYSLW